MVGLLWAKYPIIVNGHILLNTLYQMAFFDSSGGVWT